MLNALDNYERKKMTLTEIEKEIITAIRESRKINGLYPNPVKLIKKLFKEYREEKKYITETINGILKGDK